MLEQPDLDDLYQASPLRASRIPAATDRTANTAAMPTDMYRAGVVMNLRGSMRGG